MKTLLLYVYKTGNGASRPRTAVGDIILLVRLLPKRQAGIVPDYRAANTRTIQCKGERLYPIAQNRASGGIHGVTRFKTQRQGADDVARSLQTALGLLADLAAGWSSSI
jgi:hypothetical protein